MVAQVRVVSVPTSHVYVQHIRDDCFNGLPATGLPGPGTSAQVLQPQWVQDHRDTFDVVHLHFGFDACPPGQLAQWVQALHEAGKKLVYTAHDLRNPHHLDAGTHDQQLDVLVGGADAVLTLTPGAAAEMRLRWGRTALVVPHPHVVPLQWLHRPRPAREGFVVGVHLKSLRANVVARPVLESLVEVTSRLPGASLMVNVHTELIRPDFVRHDPSLLAYLHQAHAAGELALVVHERFDDDQLWQYLMGLDLSVLAYGFGTHSGWLEACFDLGTAVLAPRHGYWHEQQRCLGYDMRAGVVDAASVADAVRSAYAIRPTWRADPAARSRQQAEVAQVHHNLYSHLMDAT